MPISEAVQQANRRAKTRNEAPAGLRLHTPNGYKELSGIYYPVNGRVVNGQPLYQMGGTEKYFIYAGTDKRWFVGDDWCEDNDFQTVNGFIMTVYAHGDLLPHEIKATWSWHDGDTWRVDEQITFTKAPPRVLQLASPYEGMSGLFEMLEGKTANGQPIWKMVGSSYWIFSSNTGMWKVGDADEEAAGFQCDRGFISSMIPHEGLSPHEIERWSRGNGSAWDLDWSITVTVAKVWSLGDTVVVVHSFTTSNAVASTNVEVSTGDIGNVSEVASDGWVRINFPTHQASMYAKYWIPPDNFYKLKKMSQDN